MPLQGDVFLDGVRINDVPTNKRDVHTVFSVLCPFSTYECL